MSVRTKILDASHIAQQTNDPEQLVGMVSALVAVGMTLVIIAGGWKLYEKADKPGWGYIIPIYREYLHFKINGRSGLWLLALIFPLTGIFVWFWMNYELAQSFGRGIGYGLGLAVIPAVFVPLLGFNDTQYQGPAAA